jgi:hypothetical protein
MDIKTLDDLLFELDLLWEIVEETPTRRWVREEFQKRLTERRSKHEK